MPDEDITYEELGQMAQKGRIMNLATPQRYCLGFILDTETESVLLAYKGKGEVSVHPDRFNGIGGKLLPDESAGHAMFRECREATGQNFQLGAWRHLGYIRGPVDHRWEVACFATRQAVKPWLFDLEKGDALILVAREKVHEFGLAPYVNEFVEHAFRVFAAIDPPEPLVIYDAGGPHK